MQRRPAELLLTITGIDSIDRSASPARAVSPNLVCVEYILWFPCCQAGAVAFMDGRARVAWHLRRLRVARGLSQEALAVDAGVDRTYVSGIERGSFNPTVEILDRLAAALSCDVAEFFVIPRADAVAPAPLRPGRRKV